MELLTAVLHSVWLIPVLVVMITVDGPLPAFPTETLFLSAAAAAGVAGNEPMLAALFAAAVAGSMAGDLTLHTLGRGSHRVLPRSVRTEHPGVRWVRANLFRRPVAALVVARLLPGGRLAGCAAAGRLGLAVRPFLAGSAVSSLLWAGYLLATGVALGPVTGGNPLLCVLAGVVVAVLTTAGFALVRRVRPERRPEAGPEPALAGN